MTDSFYRTFLQSEEASFASPPGAAFQLGLFGKHPAWDDHMEDIGMHTPSLRIFKRVVYIDGIGGQIDRGAWEQLDDGSRLEFLDHFYLWQGREGFILAKSWRSSDGKRRKSYPMIACVHHFAGPLSSGLANYFATLDALASACAAATTREEVAAAHAAAEQSLGVAAHAATSSAPPGPEEWSAFLDSREMDPGREGFFRSLHFMRGNLESFRPSAPKAKNWSPEPRQMRLPLCAPTGCLSFILWASFLRSQLDPSIPLLLFRHLECDWIDATIGEPGAAEFFRLRAGLGEIPFTNQVPYRIPEELREQFERVLVALAETGGAPPTIWGDESPASTGVFRHVRRWLHADSS